MLISQMKKKNGNVIEEDLKLSVQRFKHLYIGLKLTCHFFILLLMSWVVWVLLLWDDRSLLEMFLAHFCNTSDNGHANKLDQIDPAIILSCIFYVPVWHRQVWWNMCISYALSCDIMTVDRVSSWTADWIGLNQSIWGCEYNLFRHW